MVQLRDDVKPILSRFFLNLEHLRAQRGLTKLGMKEAIKKELNVDVSYNASNYFLSGRYADCRLTYLAIYCRFFGVSLPEMLSCDLSAAESLASASEGK